MLNRRSQGKFILCVDQVTNNDVSNGSAKNRALYQILRPYVTLSAFLSLATSGPINRHFKGSLKANDHRQTRKKSSEPRSKQSRGQAITIDILPDDVLLEVFDFYVGEVREIEAWQLLAHVCRQWRSLLFGSPRRLKLQLVCTPRTPPLDVWPALPLVIQGHISPSSGVDNTVAALRRSRHVCKIDLWESSGSESEKVLAAMQQPFPEITHLQLGAYDAPIVPDSFLGGSAPRLQYLQLERIPFQGLPKLLSSAIHLVQLHLHLIPQSGYISPEVMITCLTELTSLERLSLGFQSPQSYPNRESQRPPPPTRSILPTL